MTPLPRALAAWAAAILALPLSLAAQAGAGGASVPNVSAKSADYWLDSAKTGLLSGDANAVIADSSRSLQFDPKSAVALVLRAGGKYANADYDGAIADYTRAMELGANAPVVFLERARAYLAKGDWTAAIPDLDNVVNSDPKFPLISEALVLRADANSHKSYNEKQVYDDYAAALALDPKASWLLLHRAGYEYYQEKRDDALADYTRALELDPAAPGASYRRGTLLLAKGDPRGAIESFARQIKLTPDSYMAWLGTGVACEMLNNAKDAAAAYHHAIDLALKDSVRRYFRGLDRSPQTGPGTALDIALEDCDHYLAHPPSPLTASHVQVIRFLVQYSRGAGPSNGDIHSAEAADNPEVSGAFTASSLIQYYISSSYLVAAEHSAAAVKHDPNSPMALFVSGISRASITFIKQNDIDGGLADLDHAIALDPGFSYSYLFRSYFRGKKGDAAGAKEDYDSFIAHSPDPVAATGAAGCLFFEKKDWARAAAAFRRYCDYNKGDLHDAHIFLWISQARNGAKDEADKELAAFVAQQAATAPDPFKTTIENYLLGKTREADLVAAAKSADRDYDKRQLCQAWFCIGEKDATNGLDSAGFSKSRDAGEEYQLEHKLSHTVIYVFKPR